MWSNIGANLGDKLANLGESLTASAESHAKRMRDEQQQQSNESGGGGATIVSLPPPPTAFSPNPELKEPRDYAQEVLDKEAGRNTNSTNNDNSSNNEMPLSKWTSSLAASFPSQNTNNNTTNNNNALFGNLKSWTDNVVSQTKQFVDDTREVWEKEQARIQTAAPSLFHRSGGGVYTRDISLPLDVDALRDAEVVYVTDRIITLSHPYMASTDDGDISPARKLAAVSQLLNKRHGSRYMVYNLSEVEYDTYTLEDMVLTYKFPGSPSPPLGMLLKLLLSMESWLKADERNVAVIHCLTGRGRTSTVLAAFLCWTGEAGFGNVNDALEYIAKCKRVEVQALTIPSQVRYAGYFANMLDGIRPSQPPLLLKRVIMSDAPQFGKRRGAISGGGGADRSEENEDGKEEEGNETSMTGCAPYLQIFKAGNLIFTTAASVNYAQTKDDLPFCSTDSGPVSFLTESIVQGDILLRCRHLTKSGQRISMFRCAFHTGYVPPKVLRLTKAQLDGACGDKRFKDDFFLDLIFEPCDEATASMHLATTSDSMAGSKKEGDEEEVEECANEAASRRSMGTVAAGKDGTSENTFTASAYDSMLHRDSRFWDVIAQRRKENMEKIAELEKRGGTAISEAEGKEGDNQPLVGPTIGRRRDFTARQSSEGANGEVSDQAAGGSTSQSSQNPMGAFSIGEEFGIDFETTKPPSAPTRSTPSSPPPKPKQDALMDALNDLDDADLFDDDDVMTEEIDFGNTSEDVPEPLPSVPAETTKASSIPPAPVQNDVVPSADAPTDNVSNTIEIKQTTAAAKEENEDALDNMEDDLANLNLMNDAGEDDLLGDAGEFDDFDDLDDDAELEDLENFLTQVSKN